MTPVMRVRVSVADVERLALPVAKAASGKLAETLTLAGRLEFAPYLSQQLHPRFPGVVTEVGRSVGDVVRAGDRLARVENAVGMTFELLAGVSGTVLERNVAQGQSVDEDLTAFVVADTTELIARLVAYPRDLQRLKPGLEGHLLDAYGTTVAKVPLTYVAPILDPENGTAVVLATIKNPEGKWRAGQFITAKVETGTAAVAVRVASVALETGELSDEAKLYVKDGDAFVLRPIRVGRSDGSSSEVVGGLALEEEYLKLSPADVRRRVSAQGGGDGEGEP
jgi:cobalt-zinc-cadmium efflux system membrane fusion protein